jgi:hypothetical protein
VPSKIFQFEIDVGEVKHRTIIINAGMDPNKMYGRNLPHFVEVLSAIYPIIGSVTASHILAIKNTSPAFAGDIPNISV